MIRVQIETENTYIHYKNVDRVTIDDETITLHIGNCMTSHFIDGIISYEIRKDKKYNEI